MDEQYVLATPQYIRDNTFQYRYYVGINGNVYSFEPIRYMKEVPHSLQSVDRTPQLNEIEVSATNIIDSNDTIDIHIRRKISHTDNGDYIQTFVAV